MTEASSTADGPAAAGRGDGDAAASASPSVAAAPEPYSFTESQLARLARSVTPLDKVARNLNRLGRSIREAGRQPVVLVTTGSYNPPHLMHLRMFYTAKRVRCRPARAFRGRTDAWWPPRPKGGHPPFTIPCSRPQHLEERTHYFVVGGLMSPAHEQTVRSINRNSPVLAIPAVHRVRMCDALTGPCPAATAASEFHAPLTVCSCSFLVLDRRGPVGCDPVRAHGPPQRAGACCRGAARPHPPHRRPCPASGV